MKASLTGASGLLGSNLSALLCRNGWQVSATYRPSSPKEHLKHLPIVWHQADLLDEESLRAAFDGVDVVFHCAGLIGYGPLAAKELDRVNVIGTRNVINAARSAKVKRLIHCSSVDAIGLPIANLPANESCEWNFDKLGIHSAYARSKYEAEVLVRQASADDLDAVIVNPTFMVGPYLARPSSGELVLRIAKSPILFAPHGKNNFVDVRDVASGMLYAFERGKRGDRYILGGANLSYFEFFELVRSVANSKAPLFRLPSRLGITAAKISDLVSYITNKPFSLSSELIELASLNHTFSSGKAEAELGYRSSPIERAIADCLSS